MNRSATVLKTSRSVKRIVWHGDPRTSRKVGSAVSSARYPTVQSCVGCQFLHSAPAQERR